MLPPAASAARAAPRCNSFSLSCALPAHLHTVRKPMHASASLPSHHPGAHLQPPPLAAARPLLPLPAVLSSPPPCCRHIGSRCAVRCRSGQDDFGGQPPAQPPDFQQQQQQQQQWPPGSNSAGGGTPAGSWVARTDNLAMKAFRAVVGCLRDILTFLQALVPLVRETLALIPHLHYPTPGFVLRRTIVVLLVVAAFVGYVWVVDGLCSYIPRAILWTHANPGWLRRAFDRVVAAAAQRLAGG